MRLLFFAIALLGVGCSGDKPLSDSGELVDESLSSGDTSSDSEPPVDTGTSTDDPLPDGATVELGGACALEELLGGFHVTDSEKYTVVDGSVADAVLPISILTEVAAEGDCSLLRRENPFCDPRCEPDETCNLEGECIPYPSNQDLGTVRIDGLAEPVEMNAIKPGSTYFATGLSHPAMTVGGAVRLRSEGSPWGPIELYGVGVEPLMVDDTTLVVQDGDDMPVSWMAPTTPGRAEVRLRLNIDQHGVTPVSLYCLFEDTGTAVVPSSVIDALLAQGVSGFPSVLLSRRTVDRQDLGDGCVELVVESPREAPVDVEGFIPCDSPDDCPTGMECVLEVGLCE